MPALTPAVSAWLAAHHGVATYAQLRKLGMTRDQIYHLVAVGIFVRPVRRVLVLAAAPAVPAQAAAIACAVAPDVVVSHQSAARLWRMRGIARGTGLHVVVPWGAKRTVPDAVVHRSTLVDATDVVQRGDGIRLTSPPRTAFDAASYLDDKRFESLVEQVLDKHCTLPTLLATGRRLAARGRPGTDRFIRVVHSRPAWLKPVDSDLELRVERAIVAAGLPRPLRQHPVDLGGGELVHPDFLWLEEREALEIDHVTWHGGKLDLTYDKQRDRRMWTRAGIHVNRVTDAEISAGLDRLLDDLATALAGSRGRRSALGRTGSTMSA